MRRPVWNRRQVLGAGAAAAGLANLRGATAAQVTGTATPALHSQIVVQRDDRQQTIDGFGVSGAWWAQEVGGWDDANRRRVIELLFDRTRGIGLSIYRYNIGAGGGQEISDPWRRAETFYVSPGAYNWSRDTNALWVLQAARAAGVSRFVAFANSPPAAMTISSLASGAPDGGSNLASARYPDFARYLVDVTAHLQTKVGVPIGWLSPVNEPLGNWNPAKGQEGCHYSVAETVAVARAVQQAIEGAKLNMNLTMPESETWSNAARFLTPLLGDPALALAIDRFATHSYLSSTSAKRKLAAAAKQFPHAKLWMSEWTELIAGRDTGMSSALQLAMTMHDDLTIGGVTAWQYWIAVSRYDFHDGLIYTDAGTQHIIETKRLWTMGNFARFVSPGAVRVTANASGGILRVSAYRLPPPDQQCLAVVAINPVPWPVIADLQIAGPSALHAVAAYETSARHNLAPIALGPTSGPLSLPSSSVMTLIFDG